MITAEQIKKLRQETGAGMMDCKKALGETGGDEEKAKTLLRKSGLADMEKRSSRVALEGHVGHYIHAGGKIAVLCEVNCETDFVAKNEEFQSFVHNLAMHIAAASPDYLDRSEVPSTVLEKEREVARRGTEGKPDAVAEKMIDGRLEKFYKQVCLLEQTYIRDQNLTITDLLGEQASKLGEKIVIRRFVRFEVGEDLLERK